MQKSFRSLALVATLALTAAPSLHAARTGCNPPPQAASVSPTLGLFASVVLSALGF